MFFSERSHNFNIKLMGMKHRTPCRQIFCPFTHPQPLDGVKRTKLFFLKVIFHINTMYKEKSLEHYTSKMFDLVHTTDLLGLVKRSDIELCRLVFWLNLVTLLALAMI